MRHVPGRTLAATLLLVLLTGCGATGSPKAHTKPPTTTKGKTQATSNIPWKATAASSVLPGDVLIADAGNNRMLLVTPQGKIVWQYPAPGEKSALIDDDDVFFSPDWTEIITNEEGSNQLAILNFNTRKIVWTYGHQGVAGSAPGYLHTPDDAFLYGLSGSKQVITVADIVNQRILFIDRRTGKIIKQYGQTRVQKVNPPLTFGAPNGDFPAPNGGMLVTQINGDDAVLLDKAGQVVYTVHFPTGFSYPSDANFTPSGNIICVSYTNPGQIVIMSPQGQVLWHYKVTSGPGMLNMPSLAVQLPNGNVLLNDDYNDRVIVIDPNTNQIVWQYGHTGVTGTAPGYLHEPDGVDFLPVGITPGAPGQSGHHLWSYPGNGY